MRALVGATRQAAGVIVVNYSEATIDGGRPSEAVAQADGSWLPVTGQKKQPYSVMAQRWFADALGTDAIVVTGPYEFAEGEAIAAARPPGGLAAFYVARSAEAARQPPETPWDGVDDFSKK